MANRILAKNIGSMSLAVLISRFFGLARDIIFAGFFGASYVADAFQVGYQIPNLLRKLFGEGALSAAFIPIYNELEQKKGRSEQIKFALNILSLLTLFLTFLTLLGIILAPLIARILAPGFDEQSYSLTVKLTRIMFPYLFLIGLSSTLISILNSHNYFFIPGLSSALLNIGMILFLGTFYFLFQGNQEEQVTVLAFGVLFGGILQTIVNLPLLKKIGYQIHLNFNMKGQGLQDLWRRFIPGVVGLAIREVNLAVDIILASFLITGSIAALQYGNRLMQLPLGIIGISASSAVLPMFSRYTAARDWKNLSESLRFSTVTLVYLMLPVTVLFVVLGKDIIRLIFMRGAFDIFALDMTYRALLFYSLGLVFYSLTRTVIPIYYANKDTKTPVKISAGIVLLNIILNIVLMQYLQHAGLALASSLSSLVHYVVLMNVLKKKLPEVKLKRLGHNVLKIILMSLILFLIVYFTSNLFKVENILDLIIKISVYLIGCSVIYYLGTYLLKVEYIHGIKELLWRRFRR